MEMTMTTSIRPFVHVMLVAIMAGSPVAALAQHKSESETAGDWQLRASAELGALAVFSHKIQFGKQGTYFDYRGDGAQDTLLFNQRLSLEVDITRKHTLVFLYQPLSIVSTTTLRDDLVVDDVTFKTNTPMNFRYDFPFYRISYIYDFSDDPRMELSIGGSLQIRNATIVFESADGVLSRSNRDVGPVPALKGRFAYTFDSGLWIAAEADGIWAPIKYFNGSDNGVEGAILDTSVRVGVPVAENLDVYFNLRYLGGGAEGQSDPENGSDGYTKNWLHFGAATLGFQLEI